MTLDLSFKELVDAAANPNAATGRPLLVAIDCIDEDPDQPRRNFSEQELEELSRSIGEHGVLQPSSPTLVSAFVFFAAGGSVFAMVPSSKGDCGQNLAERAALRRGEP